MGSFGAKSLFFFPGEYMKMKGRCQADLSEIDIDRNMLCDGENVGKTGVFQQPVR
jgi:hypothetical protein